MKTLLLATHNAHKVEEFRAILASLAKDTGKDYRVLSFRDVPDIPEVEDYVFYHGCRTGSESPPI